jgi:hypothetical protein
VSAHGISLTSVVFLSWLAACDGSVEPAAPLDVSLSSAEVSRENFTFQIDQPFDCTAAGGEIIDVSGTLHQTTHVILKEDGFTYVTLTFNAEGITGIGRSSGDTYQAPGTGLDTFKFRFQPPGDSFIATFHDLTHLVRTGSGGGAGTLWGAKINGHITVTPDGHVSEHSFDFSDCVAL